MSRKLIGYEVFHEDVCRFWQDKLTGTSMSVVQKLETRPCLWRARVDLVNGGVEWQLLGHLHARVVATYSDTDGVRMVQIVGINGHNQPFECEVRERDFLKGNHRFWGKMFSSGGVGCIVYPGHYHAVLRAIKALSAEDAEQEVRNHADA